MHQKVFLDMHFGKKNKVAVYYYTSPKNKRHDGWLVKAPNYDLTLYTSDPWDEDLYGDNFQVRIGTGNYQWLDGIEIATKYQEVCSWRFIPKKKKRKRKPRKRTV